MARVVQSIIRTQLPRLHDLFGRRDCRAVDDGRFYHFNDSRVSAVPGGAASLSPSSSAYVLVYWRRDAMRR
jgi:hypothetical protein